MSEPLPLPEPPAHIAWLIELVGHGSALALLELHAGTTIYIPRRVDGSWVERDIGTEAATLLCSEHGGGHIELPLVKAWRCEMHRLRGLTHRAIALRLGMTENSVRRYLNRASLTNREIPTVEPAPPVPARQLGLL